MGLNTIHDKTNDVIPAFNITQKIAFKCEKLGNSDTRAVEVAKGLEVFALTLTIKVNGKCSIKEKDKIRLFGKVFQVVTISDELDNQEQFRKRADIENFTGSKIVGLE